MSTEKRGRGRPKGSGIYTEAVLLRLTPGQHQDFAREAERDGVALAEWLRRAAMACMQKEVSGMERQQLAERVARSVAEAVRAACANRLSLEPTLARSVSVVSRIDLDHIVARVLGGKS